MNLPNTTVLNLVFLAQGKMARLYRSAQQNAEQWIPSSVCPQIFKHGNERGSIHEVTIEDWWLKENPFVKAETEGQASLFDE